MSIALEGMSFRTAINESNTLRGKASWPQFIRGARSPELPVILLEDFAALTGLVLALAGVVLTLATGNGVWDGLGSMAIGALLVVVAFVLAVEMKSLLIGESATREAQRRIEAAITGAPGVERLIHIKTLHVGPEEVLVAAKFGVALTDRPAVPDAPGHGRLSPTAGARRGAASSDAPGSRVLWVLEGCCGFLQRMTCDIPHGGTRTHNLCRAVSGDEAAPSC